MGRMALPVLAVVLASSPSLGCGTFAGVGWGSAIPRYHTVPTSAEDALEPDTDVRLSSDAGVAEGSLVRTSPRFCLRERDDRVHCLEPSSIHSVERRDSYWLEGMLIGMGADALVGAIFLGVYLSSQRSQPQPLSGFAP
jgi:hypothetical protein